MDGMRKDFARRGVARRLHVRIREAAYARLPRDRQVRESARADQALRTSATSATTNCVDNKHRDSEFQYKPDPKFQRDE